MRNNVFRAITVLFISTSLIFAQCRLLTVENYMRVGDVDGKEIFTKSDYLYECNTTVTKQGPCEKWKSEREEFNGTKIPKIAIKEESFNGSATEMFNLIAAYNGIQYIWAGWRGICTDGTITDFSWAKDPLYWAGIAMQAYGSDMFGGNAAPSGATNVSTGATSAATTTATKTFMQKYGSCLVQAGLGAASVVQKLNDDGSGGCDPVDEFCDEDEADSPDKVISVDQQTWDDMLMQTPELANYTEVLSSENGIVVVRFNPNDQIQKKLAGKDADDARQKAKEMEAMFGAAKVAIGAAVCAGTAAFGESKSSSAPRSTGSVTSASSLLTNFIGTWNHVLGAALNVLFGTVSSFKDVDSCNKMGDAEDMGGRHIKTFTHKRYDMCHLYNIEKKGNFIAKYKNYHYCCYPDVTSRILSEQIKAQLARGWSHCTDITFTDLSKVDFKACTPLQMNDPGVLDGKNIKSTASQSEREKAFQFKFKCIDYTDLQNYIEKQIGEGAVNGFNFDNQLEKLQKDSFEVK